MRNVPYKTYGTVLALAKAVFCREVRERLNAAFSGVFFGKLRITLESGDAGTSYTFLKKPGWAVIHLSLGMACQFAGADPYAPVAQKDVYGLAKLIKLGLEGFAYHEMGHLKHTDMSGECFKAVPKEYAFALGFIKETSNVLEDPTQEKEFSSETYYRFTKPLFRLLVKRLFLPQAKAYEDDGSIASFLNYVLLYLRCGPQAIAGKNAIFDSLEPKGLMAKIRAAHRERDAKERCRKQIGIAIWLIDELGLKEPDVAPMAGASRPIIVLVDKDGDGNEKQTVLQPQASSLPPISVAEGGEGDGAGEGTPDADVIDLRKKGGKNEESGGEKEDSAGRNSGKAEKGEAQETPGKAEGDGNEDAGSDGSKSPKKNAGNPQQDFDWEIGADDALEISSEGMLESSFDPDVDRALRLDAQTSVYQDAFYASDAFEIEDDGMPQAAFQVAAKALGGLPSALAESLKSIKAETAPRERHFLSDGDEIDIDDYMDLEASNSCSLEAYRDEVPGREITDLAISLLVDCSGSMSGRGSKCAFAAAVMVELACEEADIPTEISAFSTGGILYLKRFEDDPDICNGYLGILSDSISSAYSQVGANTLNLWGGTDCESALAILLSNLEKYDGKQRKLVFVITDGDTGNPKKVGALVRGAREEGTVVIGIGIGTSESNLRRCFEHCKSFDLKTLNDLPDYVAWEIQTALGSKGFLGY